MTINTQDPTAEDVFQIARIAQAAAYSVKECVTDYRGVKVEGKTLIGSKQDFNVTVVGSKIANIADGMATIPCKRRLLVRVCSFQKTLRCVFHPGNRKGNAISEIGLGLLHRLHVPYVSYAQHYITRYKVKRQQPVKH